MERKVPNRLQFKFSISKESVHISRTLVSWWGIISTAATIRSQTSWRQDLKRRRLQISRKINRLARQLSTSSVISKVNLDDPHLILRSSSAHKHQDEIISYQLHFFDFSSACSVKRKSGGMCTGQKLTLTGWHHVSKQSGDSATPYPFGARSVHTEVTLCPEDASTPTTLVLSVIPELPPLRRLQLRAWWPRQQIIHDLRRQLHSLIFPHVHNMSCPLALVVIDRGGFLACNSNNQAPVITVVTTN